MGYINNGVSKSLMEKLSSAAGTAQNANIRNGKKYNTDNLSSSLAQKLGFTTVKGSVSSSGKESVKTQEDENKIYKTLSEHPEWGLNDKGVITDKKDSSYFMKDGQLIKKQDENTDNLLQNSYAKLINSDKGEENSFLNSSPANSTEISNAVKGIISNTEYTEKHFVLDSAAKAQENNRKEKLYNEYAEKYKDLSTAEEFITAAHKSNNDDEKVWLNNKANILLQEQKNKEDSYTIEDLQAQREQLINEYNNLGNYSEDDIRRREIDDEIKNLESKIDVKSKENDKQIKLNRLENLNQQKEDLQKELESTEDENKRKEIQNKINAVSLGIGKLKGETKDIRYKKQQEEYAEQLKDFNILSTIKSYYDLQQRKKGQTVYGPFGKTSFGSGTYLPKDGELIVSGNEDLVEQSFNKLKDSGIDADALLEYYSKNKENEQWQKTLKEVEKLTDNPAGAIANNAMSVAAKLGQVIDAGNIIGSAVTEMFTNEKQVPEARVTDFINTVREKTQENIHYSIDNPVLKYLAESAYGTGMSMADFLYTMPFGEASLPILSTSAGTTEAKRLLDDGVSTEKALLGGIAAGIAEGFFEKFSIEQLKMFKQNGASGFKNGIINALKGFTVEGSEEAATDIANAITNTLILQDDSDFTKSYNSYIKDGLSAEEAKNKVAAEFAAQVANDFVWGGVSGGIMSAGASVIGNHINRQNTKSLGTSSKEIGQAIIDSGDEAVKEIIYNAANNQTNSKLNKLGNKLKSIYESGKDVNPADLGNLQKMFEMQSLNALVDEGLKYDKDTKAYKSAKIISQQIKDGESVNYNSFKVLERNLGMNTVSKVLDENENQIEINKSNDVPRHSNVTISKTIHPNGVAATTDDGRKIVIAQIESADADSDSAYIYTTDGEKLSTDGVKVSDTNYYAILNAASQFDTNGAKAMAVNYEKSVEDVGEISGYDYAKNFYKLYDAGRQGITYEQAVNKPEYSLAINAIGIRASHLAFASAKNDMNPNTKYWRNEVKSISQVSVNNETMPLTSGRIYITKGTELANDDVSNAVAAVDKLAQKAGIDIVLSNKLEENENGRYDGEHIVINVNKPAEYILSVAFHEVGHKIANNNPEAFNIVKEFVFEYLKKKGVDVNQRINNIKYTYRNVFSAEEAQKSSEEEIVCNALMSIPSEEKAMEVINDMEQDEKRSLLSALKKFIQKIKAFLSKYAKTTAETKAYIGDVENITKLAEMVKNSIIDTDKKSEQGRNTRLDIDGKDVVFAESGVSYFSKIKKSSKEDQPTIKEQIKTHLTQLNNMKPVANISSKGRDNRNYSKIKEDILAEYKKIGNVVDRQNFGFIELSKKEVSISLSYLKSDAEIATFAAVPKVLKRGIEIDHHKSHKDRGYDSWTFAAPVIINGKKGFVGVVVRKTGQYRYKTHRIVATDGTEFVLIKENAEARNLGVTTKKNDSKGSNITTAFNETIPQNNTDVKYSLNDVIDNEYLEAVKNNDIEIAQKLVDEAAKENGYTIKAYHGTTNQHGKSTWNEKTKSYDTEYKRFTVFKKQYDEQAGHFFNDDIDNAGGYGSFLYSVYLKIKKPLVIDCNGQNYASITFDGKEMDTYEWADYAKKHHYDGVVFKNISDGVGYDDLSRLTNDYVVFNSNQIKSSEPITYDDKGNVIPLSKRFIDYSVDIRYSLEEPGDYTDDDFSELDSDNDLDFWEAAEGRTLTENERRILEGELADMDRKVSEKVKDTTAILEEMNNLTRDMNVNETDLKKLLRKYCREYSSKKNVDAFTRDAKIVINALKVSKSQEEFNINFRLMCGLFKDMLEKSEGTDDIFKDEREDIKSQLKRINKIVLNQVQYEEAVSAYDGWKNYRNQIFHTANICKPGSKTNSIVPGHGDMSLDEVWATLAEQYPEFFDSSISDGDQPLELIAVLNRLKPQVVNPVEQSGLNLNDLSLDLALKFTADVYDLQYKNVSDEKVQQLKKQFKEKAKELNDRRKVRFDKRVKALQEKAKEERKLLNAKFKDAVRTKGVDNWLKQQGKYVLSEEDISGERAYAIYEVTAANPAKALIKLNKKKATEYREKIRKFAVYVTRWGVRPNKKVFMPTNFSKAWGNVINAITVTKDGDTPKIWDNFVTLKDEYSKLKVGSKSNKDIFSDNETQFTPEMLSYSEIIYNKLDEVTNMVKGKTIYDLTGDELEDIYIALQAVVNNIENARNLIIKGKTLEMTGFAIDCMNEIKSTKVKVDNTLKEVLHKYTLASINPQRFFKHISNYDENSNIYKLGEMLNDGQVKTIDLKKQWTMTFNEYVAKNEKLLRTLTGENAKVIDTGIITSDGKHLSITPGMALSIYMHNLNKDNLKHIVNGGMLFPDIELYKQGKISKSIEKGTKFVLTLGDIKSICKIVENDECLMQAVKLMKQLFEDQALEINNNTIQLYGYEAAVIDNYFPIHTDKNFLNTDIEALKYDKSLEGSGFLKSRVHSPNPVILEDAFDTVLRQIDTVSQFCGLAVPISNFMKVYNIRAGYDTSFKQEIEKVWGKDTKAYIEKMVADLNGTKRSYSMLDRTRSNFTRAVLEINISVTMKQFSAYPIAAATLGWKPIIKAMKKGLGRADIELIGKYTSLYWDRNQGNSDLIGKQGQKDIGDVARKRTREQKHQFIFNWIQKTDIAVVGRLWYASEYYVNDNFPELKNGSEDYYLKVAEIFNKTLQETQQMYTTMQMPGILRNDNKVVRELTMFMSQNLQEFGLLFEATNNLRAKSKVYKELKTKQAKLQLQKAKVQFARALSAKIVSSLMTGAIIFLVNFALNKKDKYLDENGEMTIFSVGKQVGIDWLANIFGSMLGGSELYDLIYASITREQYYGIGLTSLQPIIDGLDDIYKLFTSNDFEQAKSRSSKLALDISQIFGIPLNNVMRIINGIYGNAMAIINGTMLTPDYANMNDSTKTTAMYNALMKGDREKYAKIYNTFISQGKDDSDIQSKLKIMLKSQNDDVVKAAQALIDSNLDVYEKCIDNLVNLGFNVDTIQSAISNKKKEMLKSDNAEEPSENTKVYTTDELFGEKNGSSYSYSMLFDELKDGDITDYQRILNSMISDGVSKKKIEQSMNSRKSSLVNTYINAEDGGSDKADDYYQQLINVYGSKSKADTAISNKKKKR